MTPSLSPRHALIVGACLVVAPVLNAVGDVVTPVYAETPSEAVGTIAAQPRAHFTATVLWLLALAVEVPAVIGMGTLGGGRSAPLARYGRGMALTGMGALAVLTAYEVKLAWLVAGQTPAVASSVGDVTGGGSYGALLVLAQLHLLGLVALALALRQAGVGPRLAPELVVAGAMGGLVASLIPSKGVYVAASLVLAAGLVAIGVRVLGGGRTAGAAKGPPPDG